MTLSQEVRSCGSPHELQAIADRIEQLERHLASLRAMAIQTDDMLARCTLSGGPVDALREQMLIMRYVATRAGGTPFDDVRAFAKHFGFDPPSKPWRITPERCTLRRNLIREEAGELDRALESGDLDCIAQEGVDLLYVTYGAFVDTGIRPEPIWEAVHGANMLKEQNPTGGKVIKPAGWKKPDITRLVRRQAGLS